MGCGKKTCADKVKGKTGAPGTSSIEYRAYASDSTGANFSLVPSNTLKWTQSIVKSSAIASLSIADFTGIWVKYIGDDGTNGINGSNGANGIDAVSLFNNLSQVNSGVCSGVTPVLTENIPANTLIDDGDQIRIQLVAKATDAVVGVDTSVYPKVGNQFAGAYTFGYQNDSVVFNITVDRVSPSSYLLSMTAHGQTAQPWTFEPTIITGADFTQVIAVEARVGGLFSTSTNVRIMKLFAEYKPAP